MTALSEFVRVSERFARSSNLERDTARVEPLEGYVVTARALDVVQRISSAAISGPAGGAWSLTGPYGSGKSSLALLLDAAFGPAGQTRDAALALLNSGSDAGLQVGDAHSHHRTEQRGFHRGMVTACREPLTLTVLRALQTAVCRSYGKIPPIRSFPAAKVLRQALEDAEASVLDPRRTGPSPAGLLEVAQCLAADGPLLLVFDEFGKNLEAVADRAATTSSDTDPYLLQQLAEAGQGHGLPIFILTLQHQSFDDYLSAVEIPKRREWAKVQGRFEDVAYVESPAQTRALIGSVFTVDDEKLLSRIQRWARPQSKAMQSLGVADLADPAVAASCWPLHPVAAVVLSELCRRYGQHERTLFSFLTGQEVAGKNGFLATTDLPNRGTPPVLGLDDVYDYFVGSGGLTAMTAASSSRWIEIATRLRDAHGLSDRQLRVAKTVAMLNLVSTSGTIRASEHVMELIEPGTGEILDELCESGIVTYRSFSDEYRIWQGTDVDIRSLVEEARLQVQRRGIFEVMSSMSDPQPVVAARHSAKHDCLRVFCQRFVSCNDKADPLDAFSPYDGQVLLVVDGDQPPPLANIPVGGAKPTVAAIPRVEDMVSVEAAARELVSLQRVLQDSVVESDWVARHEMSERLAVAQVAFEQAVFIAFSSGSCRWVLLEGDAEEDLRAGRGSSVLSDASDRAYPSTPSIPNEMINRTHLTSQGAKARRMLIEAMIEHGSEPLLGFEGNGPEVAMYKAALSHTRLHLREKASGQMAFKAPSGGEAAKKLLPAWTVLASEFDRAKRRRVNLNDIIASLQSPPIGMKAGVVPVMIVAGLLTHRDVIAIYEHGTFRPQLTSDMAERMVKNPAFFEIKHFANASGARKQVVNALAERLGIQDKEQTQGAAPNLLVGNVLSVVSDLVSRVRRLDNFTQRTRNLPPSVLTVREELLRAVEPDDLLFVSLPEAFNLPPVKTTDDSYSKAKYLATEVSNALETLEVTSNQLLSEASELLIASGGGTSRETVVERAASLDPEVLDSTIRPFVLALANDGTDDDLAWIATIATVVSQKSPAEWTDEDSGRFRRTLPQQMAAFERLLALYAESIAGREGKDIDCAREACDRQQHDECTATPTALSVTVTRPDGREHARFVNIQADLRDDLTEVLDEAMAKVELMVGSGEKAQQALLALIGERVLEGFKDE